MDEVEREPVDVMFISTNEEDAEFGPAFQRLEELVGTRGRKFFGAFYPQAKEYRACVQVTEGATTRKPSAWRAGRFPAGATCENGFGESRPRSTSESRRRSRSF